ncbi:MAG TPA: vWA domain-containing protein [Ideonella sp.]|nr:vWA domain-containing protein [Ideonella sp.]
MTLRERLFASWRRDADRWCLGAAVLALGATFLHPHARVEQPLFDHVVVFDITQSMNVEDMQRGGKPVSRLRFARQALRDALLRLPCGSKVGWGVFTEYRSLLLFAPVEICANLAELRASLDHIDNRMAWVGASEVAKGLYSGIGMAKELPGTPSLVFVTDGQEAPPVNPLHRPPFGGKAGEVSGLVVGVGELVPSPIPKSDPQGRPLGYWGADEVMQVDPRELGRGGSVGGEKMTEDPGASAPPLPGATPGSEQLSSLREAYLRLLAQETGLGYLRLGDERELAAALTAPALARPVAADADLRFVPALVALLALLARHLTSRRRWRPSLRRPYNAHPGMQDPIH